MQQPETLSDLINFVSFGHLFCQDLDLAILLHQDVQLAQTELYQMDLLDGIACATKAFGKPPGHCVRWARSALRVTDKQLQSSTKPSEARPRRAKRGSARSAAQSVARSAIRRRRRRRPPPKAAPPMAARPAGDTQTKARGY